MPKHGFARRAEFTLVNKTESAICFELLSSTAGTKEFPEVCKSNRDLRGRKSVYVQLEQ